MLCFLEMDAINKKQEVLKILQLKKGWRKTWEPKLALEGAGRSFWSTICRPDPLSSD